jgi:hypothetical protein
MEKNSKEDSKEVSKKNKRKKTPRIISILSFKNIFKLESFKYTGNSKTRQSPEKKEQSPSKSHDSELDEQEFPIIEHLLNSNNFKALRSQKTNILRIIATSAGILFIIYGVVLVSSPVERVSDNVMFGEKAMFSAFLMLIGILIILAAFADRFLDRSFFKKIHLEIENSGKKPSDPKTDSKEKNKEK